MFLNLVPDSEIGIDRAMIINVTLHQQGKIALLNEGAIFVGKLGKKSICIVTTTRTGES